MFLNDKTRKSDKDLYNDNAQDFIPIACHYDANTLLTKNGQLLQIIQINGINAEHISDKLFNLREVVRNAIKANIHNRDFAFWIHTVRRKTNLDDSTEYQKLLPANIHDLWKKKNYWHDKFVNTLYISIVYNSAAITIKNINTLIKSLSNAFIANYHEQYFTNASSILNAIVDKLITDLKAYGAVKLGVKFEGESSLSDMLFLYRRIIHLQEEPGLLPIADLSRSLSGYKYAVGGDKIEVIDDYGKKFAAMLSIKEYHEVSSESLDMFLQLPIEMITTEIFYFIDKTEVLSVFAEQNYILGLTSSGSKLLDAKGITEIMDTDKYHTNRFCHQQISIAIIGDDIATLENHIAHASEELAKIGIVHVREDINLEQTFWAQLPGNFTFIRRTAPTIVDNVAALASLHNFPTGEQYSKWGRAITLLRTEKGTPYFANFHTKNNETNTCIFGDTKSGKTLLMNFLLSEATKYNPTILYITNSTNSQIFIEATEGLWFNEAKSLINPLLCEDNETNRKFLCEFLKIICNHYITPLNEQELGFVNILITNIFATAVESRNLTSLISKTDFTLAGGDTIKIKLSHLAESGHFCGFFDAPNNMQITPRGIIAINLHNLTTKYFTEQFLPDDKKLLDAFTADLHKNNSLCMGLIYALSNSFVGSSSDPKILALDSVTEYITLNYFDNVLHDIINNNTQNNGVTLRNITLDESELAQTISHTEWIQLINTSFILPCHFKNRDTYKLLNLSETEVAKIQNFNLSSRMFLVKQNGQSLVVELSMGSLIGIIRMLSGDKAEFAIYQQILDEHPGDVNNWIEYLYEALCNIK